MTELRQLSGDKNPGHGWRLSFILMVVRMLVTVIGGLPNEEPKKKPNVFISYEPENGLREQNG